MDYIHLNTSKKFLHSPYVDNIYGAPLIPFNFEQNLKIEKDGTLKMIDHHDNLYSEPSNPLKDYGKLAGWESYNPAFQWLIYNAIRDKYNQLYGNLSDYIQRDHQSPKIKHVLFNNSYSWGDINVPVPNAYYDTSTYTFSRPRSFDLPIAKDSPEMIDYYYALYFTFKDDPTTGLPHFLHLLGEFIKYDERLNADEQFDDVDWINFDFENFATEYEACYAEFKKSPTLGDDRVDHKNWLRTQSRAIFYKAFYDTKQELTNFIKQHYAKQTLIASKEQRKVLEVCPELEIDCAPIITKLDLTELMTLD